MPLLTSTAVKVYLVMVTMVGDESFETRTERKSLSRCEQQVQEIKRNKDIFPHPVVDVYCITGM